MAEPAVRARCWMKPVGFLAALAIGLSSGPAFANPDVRKQVEETLQKGLVILGDKTIDSSTRRGRIEELAFSQFDFATMSRLVLARNWKKFSGEEQGEFVAEFKVLLSRSYGVRLDRFSDESVEVTGEQAEARGDVTVKTRVVGGEFDGAQVDFRMRNRNEKWLAIDVVIEGVSLVSNYRSQFGDVVTKKGPAGLLKQMRKKNAEPATDDAAVGTAAAN